MRTAIDCPHRWPVPELLDRLLRAHGPSGHEHLAFDACARRSARSPRSRPTRSATSSRAARGDGPLLALFAHLDVIGAAVAHVADDALIAVHQLGSWRANVAYGQRVEIRTKDGAVAGVIARKVKDNEKVEWGQLYVDIGAEDGEEARSLVAPGDPMVLVGAAASSSRTDGSRRGRSTTAPASTSRSRRCGAPRERNVAVVAAAQEELGAHGAMAAAHGLRPDVAIAIDVTYATDVPGDDPATGGHHVLGGGAAIFRGPAVNPRVFELLVEAAREEGIDAHDRGRREDVHGRGRDLRLPRGHPDRARLDPAPQHALADRDRPAERPRGVRRSCWPRSRRECGRTRPTPGRFRACPAQSSSPPSARPSASSAAASPATRRPSSARS